MAVGTDVKIYGGCDSRFRIFRILWWRFVWRFEFTDVIFIIFWTQLCYGDLEFFRCLLVGIFVGEILELCR